MKKIIFILLMFVGLQASSQTIILQNIVFEFNGTISICADTIEHEDYSCQISESIDSTEASPEYTQFITLCRQLSGTMVTSFVCQCTAKQSFTDYQRIIVRNGVTQQWIYNVVMLTTDQQKVYNDFINKCKILLSENKN